MNGSCENPQGCAHAIYVSRAARLRIERSRFQSTRRGHHIKSRASLTEIIGNEILDGPTGTASYLVDIPNGGNLILEDNILEKGPNAENDTTAISIGAEGVSHPTTRLFIARNTFTNNLVNATRFVRNRSATPAELVDNRLAGPVIPLEGPGTVR
jgi:hypothetical protein